MKRKGSGKTFPSESEQADTIRLPGRRRERSMETYYLAVDIGASSGKMELGWMENGKLCLEEVWRFPNGAKKKNGRRCWDTDALFSEIKAGLRRCAEIGKIPSSMGVDTWGVDFVLLDEDGNRLGDAVAYRDDRTAGMDERLRELLTEEELYARTGIQKQIFNTVYQLLAVKEQEPELLSRAAHLLMIPDYLHYLLTGNIAAEYTNASTTQLLDARTRNWDDDLISRLGLPRRLFSEPKQPGFCLGTLRPEIRDEVGFDCRVVLPPTHDTGSAVLAVPAEEKDFLFLSSGTWSLFGMERPEPDCSEASRRANLTNEGGFGGTIRYLKNIMGLWMLQSIRSELGDAYSFARLSDEAETVGRFPAEIDVDDPSFLAPQSMIEAVREYCGRTGQPVPQTPGELASCVYYGLAARYRDAVRELESLTGVSCPRLYIVGGGSQDGYLNRLTASAIGKEVSTGPSEGTAVGNLLSQMIADGIFAGAAEARAAVRRSFPIGLIQP